MDKYPDFLFISTDNVCNVLAEWAGASDAVKELVEARLGGGGAAPPLSAWAAEEIGDGNINYVWLVCKAGEKPEKRRRSAAGVLVKQAVPFIRIVPDWPLSSERGRFEARALAIHGRLDPAHVPRVYHFDEKRYAMVQEFLADRVTLRQAIGERRPLDGLGEHLAQYLAAVYLARHSMPLAEQFELRREFAGNHAMVAVTEKVVFRDPYQGDPLNRHNPLLSERVAELQADVAVRAAVFQLRQLFVSSAQCLVHGDLHTGSVLVPRLGPVAAAADSVHVIDLEFAFFGPWAFDAGALLANLLFAYCANAAQSEAGGAGPGAAAAEAYRLQLWTVIENVWAGVDRRLRDAAKAQPQHWDQLAGNTAVQQTLEQLMVQTSGFIAVELVRRIVGVAHVDDLEKLQPESLRAAAETRCLQLARQLLLQPCQSIDQLKESVRV